MTTHREKIGASSSSTASVKPEKKKVERLVPGKIVPTKLGDYLEIMTMATFQAGMSWALIQNKWGNFSEAFAHFNPAVVAKFSKQKIAHLMLNPGIIRSQTKIIGTIENARTLLALEAEHGSFQNYLRSFKSYQSLSCDLRQRFAGLGEMSVYYFLFRVGEKVPPFDSWIVTIEGEHPRMREMVEKFEHDKPKKKPQSKPTQKALKRQSS